MALGWCLVCGLLKPIRPGPFKLGSRERYWFPIDHDDADGKPCRGSKRGI